MQASQEAKKGAENSGKAALSQHKNGKSGRENSRKSPDTALNGERCGSQGQLALK